MFKKFWNTINGIKRSLAEIHADINYMKLQPKTQASCSNKEDTLRNLIMDITGKWVYVPKHVSKEIGLRSGNYFVFGFIANDVIGFSQDTKETIAKINMYCVSSKECTYADLDKDGVSVYFNENRLGKRIKHVPFPTRQKAHFCLLSLKSNVLEDMPFAELKVR